MGGGGQHMCSNEQQHRRHRRRPARTYEVLEGVELPPPVSSPMNGAWQLRSLQPTTFRRVCTLVHPKLSPDHAIYVGSAPVAPLIAFNFVISATDDGRLLFYTIKQSDPTSQIGVGDTKGKAALRTQQLEMDAVPPMHVIQLSASIVALAVGCLFSGYKSGQVVVLTCEGEMHIVNVYLHNTIVPTLVHSFDIGSLSPSDVCIQNDGQVFVSYRSGCLDAWQVTVPVDKQETKPTLLWNKLTIKLLWRGALETRIHSVSTIDRCTSNTYLALCIEQPPPKEGLGEQTSSSTLEVIDISRIANDWKNVDFSIDIPALALRDYLVWPEESMEVVDSSTDDVLPRQQRGRASMGSDRLLAGEGFFAAVLSDGTVATLHSKVLLANEKPSLSWGVRDNANQALLQYPAIGMGQVHLGDRPQLACSLRGGTTYLLPIASQSETPSDIPVFLFPEKDEEDDDGEALLYLHGFTAGNVKTKEGQATLPILVYAGDGGLMEVYACDLLAYETKMAQEHLCIEEMERNGSIDLLFSALQSMKEGDLLLEEEEWKNAYFEASSVGHNGITSSSLAEGDDKFQAIRSLALHLAKNT